MNKEKLPFKTWLYFLGQSITMISMVMAVSMSALAGTSLAPQAWMATIPFGFQYLTLMVVAYPAARLMARLGRKKVFLMAAVPLMLAGVAGYIAMQERSFTLLIFAHMMLGAFISCGNFNRFAATDGVPPALKPRAISLVVAGGVIAAVAGPYLSSTLREVEGLQMFAASYAAFLPMGVLSFIINLLAPADAPATGSAPHARGFFGSLQLVVSNPMVLLAVLSAALGHAIMSLLMVQSSLQMSCLNIPFASASTALQWHVLAMFMPSFFTGRIIQAIGMRSIIYGGIGLLIASCIINVYGHSYGVLTFGLIILGLGWNFCYVGGAALLTRVTEHMHGNMEIQGINDQIIAVMATLTAFTASMLMAWPGWSGTNLISIAVCVGLGVLAVRAFRREGQEGTPA